MTQTVRQLKPIHPQDSYSKAIEKKIMLWLREEIFLPLVHMLKEAYAIETREEVMNAKPSALGSALIVGKVQYVDGKFRGQFSSRISKELRDMGATWSSTGKYWSLSRTKLPMDIVAAIGSATRIQEDLNKRVNEFLLKKDFQFDTDRLNFINEYIDTINTIESDWRKASKSIGVVPEFDKSMAKTIADEYSKNLKLYVKDFTEKETLKLRTLIHENTYIKGYRTDKLVSTIQDQYQVTKAKAQFLARQETSILTSKVTELRYKDAGITKYRWSTSHDERVRDRHKHLDGKVFSYDDPPVVDDLGNKKNPGEDFNCRCVAIPIVA